MRVQVTVVCAPHPRKEVEAALRAAGERLALTADSVSVRIDPTEPRLAILEFEMRRATHLCSQARLPDARHAKPTFTYRGVHFH
jgi:hypothetical protein